ncbi:MAG TPA: Maf family protein [Ignavibacteria bacterium]|jgi:septum formation protein
MSSVKIILASASPRRKELLGSLLKNFGLNFRVIPSDLDEILPDKFSRPGLLVCNLAKEKARFVAKKNDGIVIGADTIVILKGKILGKPVSKSDAKKMLSMLSGNFHFVYTGIALLGENKSYSAYEKTQVWFRQLQKKEIDYYVESGSPMDKAGAYGIQDDYGSTFVSKINGDFFNVVGLPILKTYLGLKRFLELGV